VAGADGFTPILTISYATLSYDSSENSMHTNSINGNYDYHLEGEVAFGPGSIRVRLHCWLYVEFNEHDAGIKYTKTAQNGVDYTVETVYQLVSTPTGTLHAVPHPNNHNDAQPLSWSHAGSYDTGSLRDMIEGQIATLNNIL